MTTTYLRKVGGSLMMALPRPLLEQLQISEGSAVGIFIEGDHLVVKPRRRPHYTLDELLAQCDATARKTREEETWLNEAATGKETL